MSEVRRSASAKTAPRGAKAKAKPKAGTRRITPPDTDTELRSTAQHRPEPDEPEDRVVRRAVFLAELAEAKELRKRVAPRRVRAAELHVRLLRTYRY